MNPGPGWGGSCFPKDTQALIAIAEASGYDFPLLRGVVDLNDSQFSRMVDKIASLLLGELDNKVVALFGLTFKANTNDLRESPSIRIASILKHRGAIVHAYDPTVSEQISDIRVFTDAYECCANAEILVICTEWNEFLHLDIEKVGLLMKKKNVLDTRNILNPKTWIDSGFTYRGVGR
jgi:UDPglucose 6-dehydrogenase